jgi:hypothetical protein
VRKKPKFILDEAWLNMIELSNQNSFFKALPDNVMRNSDAWKAIYEDNEPENLPIPDFELAINDNKEEGSWLRLLLLRCVSRVAFVSVRAHVVVCVWVCGVVTTNVTVCCACVWLPGACASTGRCWW